MKYMRNYNEIFNEMFADRTHCILFQAAVYTEENHGWVGGNAPEYFDDKVEMVNINGMMYLNILLRKKVSVILISSQDYRSIQS